MRRLYVVKAAYINAPGPARSIVVGQLPEPLAALDRVLVGVKAVTVNPIDTYIRAGSFPQDLAFPFVIGRDLVGMVESDPTGTFAPGQWVWSNSLGYAGRSGSFAERVSVEPGRLYRLPDGVDPDSAVVCLHSGLTVWAGLRRCHLWASDRVCIWGGSGNVGTTLLQVARAAGAQVAVSASPGPKTEWCRELGADLVIDHRAPDAVQQLAEFAPEGLTLYWDCSGHLDLEQVLPHMAQRGRIVTMSGLGQVCRFPVGPFYTRNLSLHGFTVTDLSREELAEGAQAINRWLREGALRAPIAATLPLDEAAEAHQLVESGSLFGKVLVRV